MQYADRSHAALIKRKKGFILASWRSANPGKPEQSPSPTDASTLTDRRLGQIQYTIQNAGGGVRTEGPCCDLIEILGGVVEKDMSDNNFTFEFDPYDYQAEFFPGMADFIDENIEAGDKAPEDRLRASYWDDLGDDVFDDWGFFYIYDVSSGKYYFPLISPQNLDDGVITTQTFGAFDRLFTINHGWSAQGIFMFDISVADSLPFRFGAYGNMGSDGDEFTENLTYTYGLKTLYYHHHQEDGDDEEQLYSYWIPKNASQNTAQTYDAYYENDEDMSMVSKEVTDGLRVYFAKQNDVKVWVASKVNTGYFI
jgi:hypothetical protein